MATQIPLHRQCVFLRHQHLSRPLAAAASRTFSSTPARARGTGPFMASLERDKATARRLAIKGGMGPAPRVTVDKAKRSDDGLTEDIGLLQGTVVRAPLSELPKPITPAFWGYFWALLKSKVSGLYSRLAQRRSVQKRGLSRFLPMDAFGNKALKDRAQNMYMHLYTSFAEANMDALEEVCLPPLTKRFRDGLTARGDLQITWKVDEWKSIKVVSHRSALLGEEHPGTAYRQAVIRLESVQTVTRHRKVVQVRHNRRKRKDSGAGAAALKAAKPKAVPTPQWMPDEARDKARQAPETEEEDVEAIPAHRHMPADSSEPEAVVEYLVMQKRMVHGAEEDWKAWGFAEVSTPESLHKDERYWSRQLAAQAARTEGV